MNDIYICIGDVENEWNVKNDIALHWWISVYSVNATYRKWWCTMKIEYIRFTTKKEVIELNKPSSLEQAREVYEKLNDELDNKKKQKKNKRRIKK